MNEVLNDLTFYGRPVIGKFDILTEHPFLKYDEVATIESCVQKQGVYKSADMIVYALLRGIWYENSERPTDYKYDFSSIILDCVGDLLVAQPLLWLYGYEAKHCKYNGNISYLSNVYRRLTMLVTSIYGKSFDKYKNIIAKFVLSGISYMDYCNSFKIISNNKKLSFPHNQIVQVYETCLRKDALFTMQDYWLLNEIGIDNAATLAIMGNQLLNAINEAVIAVTI